MAKGACRFDGCGWIGRYRELLPHVRNSHLYNLRVIGRNGTIIFTQDEFQNKQFLLDTVDGPFWFLFDPDPILRRNVFSSLPMFGPPNIRRNVFAHLPIAYGHYFYALKRPLNQIYLGPYLVEPRDSSVYENFNAFAEPIRWRTTPNDVDGGVELFWGNPKYNFFAGKYVAYDARTNVGQFDYIESDED